MNDWGIRPSEYTQQEDDTILIGIMLETSVAVEKAQKMTSVPGLGFVKIGVGDLSVSIGCSQQYDSPELQTAIETLENACRTNRLPLGRVSQARRKQRKQYKPIDRIFILIGVEIFKSSLCDRVNYLK